MLPKLREPQQHAVTSTVILSLVDFGTDVRHVPSLKTTTVHKSQKRKSKYERVCCAV